MSDEKRRAHNAANAALGVSMTAGGGALSQAVGRHGSRKARIAAQIVPRGLSAVGLPIAATGIVGAARNKGQASNVKLQRLPGQVARSTVSLPKDPRKGKTDRAKDAASATLAGGLGGLVGSNAGHSPRARVVAGTVGSVATASGMLYGRQKGREDKRRKAALSKAEPRKQKTFRMPVPTALDTRDDWKTLKQRKRTANTSMATAGLGAAALTTRTPHLIQRKNPTPKVLKLRAHGNKATEVLGTAAAITGLYSAGTGFGASRHDLKVQERRLRERDTLLGRRSPVGKNWESEVAARATRGLRHGEWVGAHDPKRTKAALRGTKPTLWARGKYGTRQDDYSINEREGGFFLKPKRTIARQTNDAVYFRSYGGGMTGRGKVAIGAGAVGAGAAAAAAGRRRSPVGKDAFTSKYAQHISPEAEQGYEYLRRGRNRQAAAAAGNAVLTGVNAHAAIRGGKVLRPLGIGLGVITGANTVRNAQGAKRWNGHMKKIKAKAYERAAAGVYGRGREVAKEDLAKALFRIPRPPSGLPYPKGLRRAPTLRQGSVRRTAGGKMVAFRGSYG